MITHLKIKYWIELREDNGQWKPFQVYFHRSYKLASRAETECDIARRANHGTPFRIMQEITTNLGTSKHIYQDAQEWVEV